MNQSIKKILGGFTGRGVVAVPTILVELTGDWMLAALLAQLIYWSSRTTRKDGFIYKSLEDWKKELKVVTDYSIRKFKNLPYIETTIRKANGVPTTYYRINWKTLLTALEEYQPEPENEEIGNSEINESEGQKSTENEGVNGEINNSINIDYFKKINKKEKVNKNKLININQADENQRNEQGTSHKEIVESLVQLTEMDMKIKTNAGRIVRAAKELRLAGYTSKDLQNFGKKWKTDWRYKADKKPPAITVVLAEISKVKKHYKISHETKLELAKKELKKANGNNN